MNKIADSLLKVFRGMRTGDIDYSVDNLQSALKSDLFEEFEYIAGDFVMNVESGITPTHEELRKLHADLQDFRDTYNVKELSEPINLLNELI
jgi:hypothetical protein